MSDDIQIRTVTVELLRSGPAHNQLLSPLTLYLGVCDDAEAGIVTLPYEQHTFMRRMRAMRYDGKGAKEDKLPELRAMGVDMAKVLGAIPRLPGSLGGDGQGRDTLVHLSLVLSASELASLPFELAKVPIGPTAWTESWLALQARVPVVITRRTRNVSPGNLRWLHEPRILFISSDPHPDNIPFAEHRAAMISAVKPFLRTDELKPMRGLKGRREQFGELLTIIRNARFEEVVAECAAHRYTHIHVLAHGDTDDSRGDKTYGLRLHTEDGVISGERLASAFACMVHGAIHRPDVVTLGTCDSGNNSELIAPGASIAHVLHQAGIPLVVASQFPLSKAGSVLVAKEFYSGLLWGENPWVLLHRVRTGLHGRLQPQDHDWASLVVYESLPANLGYQLDKARFSQCSAAMDAAFASSGDWSEGAETHDEHAPLCDPVDDVIARLPMRSKYVGMQSLALRAGGRLQQAQETFFAAPTGAEHVRDYRDCVLTCCALLEEALVDYESAVNGFLVNDGQGMNAPYRALVAQLSLSAVLGRGFSHGAWHMARYWVEATLARSPEAEEKLWAQGCLAELWLLKLTDPSMPGADESPSRAVAHAKAAITAMLRLDRSGTSWPCEWTYNQLRSYVEWWGERGFEEIIFNFSQADRRSFRDGRPNVVHTAKALLDLIDRLGGGGRAFGMEVMAVDPAPEPAPAPAPKAPAKKAAQEAAKPPARQASRKAAAAATQAKAEPPGDSHLLGGAPAARGSVRPTAGGEPYLRVEMLPAGHGDALWIEYGQAGGVTHRVLVDCGTTGTYKKALKKRIEQVPRAERHFELFMLSHIDADHIGGAIPFLKEAKSLGISFGDVWFNGFKHLASMMGSTQGEVFSVLIQDNELPWNRAFKGRAVVVQGGKLPVVTLPGGMVLTVLSPTPPKLKDLGETWEKEIEALGLKPGDADAVRKRFLAHKDNVSTSENVTELAQEDFNPDSAEANGSSIAVLAEYQGKSVLLGADAHAPVLVETINLLLRQRRISRLPVSAFKVPHHASQNNLNVGLMELLNCRNYLISTNGSQFNHPDRQAIARVIAHGGERPQLWFNVKSALNEVWAKPALQKMYAYDAFFPAGKEQGLAITL